MPNPKIVFFSTILGVVLLSIGLLKLKIDPESLNILGLNSPAVVGSDKIEKRFNVGDVAFIAITPKKKEPYLSLSIPNQAILTLSDTIVKDILKIKGVSQHQCLHYNAFKSTSSALAYNVDTLLSLPFFSGVLTSFDHLSLGIFLNLDQDADRQDVLKKMEELTQKYTFSTNFKVMALGPVVIEGAFTKNILYDLFYTLPLTGIFLFFILFFLLGSLRYAIISILGAILSILVVFSIMGFLGSPIYITSTIIPILLLSISIADEIHIIAALDHLNKNNASKKKDNKKQIAEVYKSLSKPILFTSITTAAALFTFSFGGVTAIKQVGIFTGFGTLLNLYFTFFFIPSFMLLWSEKKDIKFPPVLSRIEKIEFSKFYSFIIIPVIVVICLGTYYLKVDDTWVKNLNAKDEIVLNTKEVNKEFSGSYRLLVELERKDSQGWLEFNNFKSIEGLSGLLNQQNDIKAIAITDWLSALRKSLLQKNSDSTYFQQPEYLLELLGSPPAVFFTNSLINIKQDRVLIQVIINNATYEKTKNIIILIENYVNKSPLFKTINVDFGGDAFVSYSLVKETVRQQLSSIVMSIIVMLILACIMSRNLLTSLKLLLPVCLSVLFVTGTMGWLNIPIGVATSMIPTIGIGIGIDYCIHIFCRKYFKHTLSKEVVSRGIITNAIILACSFASFLFSNTRSLQSVGILLSLTILASGFFSLFFLTFLNPKR